MDIKVQVLGCKRCGHHWTPRQTQVRVCPKCKSPYWDKEKGNGKQQKRKL